jgi:glucose-6-phosphate 1-dehydrogenase
LQNHLLQILTIFAMEPPKNQDSDSIRDAKVEVLKNMDILELQDCLLGQYDGYSDDPTITNKDTNCPTYAAIRCKINTPRWKGVPFILQAGKAMDEKLCEVRVRFKRTQYVQCMRRSSKSSFDSAPAEMVMRLQPDPCIALNVNIKTPGLSTAPARGNMVMRYQDMPNLSNPDAYTRLLLDVFRGMQGSFVRDDELRFSWQIFTPLLHTIDDTMVRPTPYKFGSQGPQNREAWMEEVTKTNLALQASL